MSEKRWYESKTIWAQVITLLMGVATLISEQFVEFAPIMLMVAAMLNTLLRFVTKEPIK